MHNEVDKDNYRGGVFVKRYQLICCHSSYICNRQGHGVLYQKGHDAVNEFLLWHFVFRGGWNNGRQQVQSEQPGAGAFHDGQTCRSTSGLASCRRNHTRTYINLLGEKGSRPLLNSIYAASGNFSSLFFNQRRLKFSICDDSHSTENTCLGFV